MTVEISEFSLEELPSLFDVRTLSTDELICLEGFWQRVLDRHSQEFCIADLSGGSG